MVIECQFTNFASHRSKQKQNLTRDPAMNNIRFFKNLENDVEKLEKDRSEAAWLVGCSLAAAMPKPVTEGQKFLVDQDPKPFKSSVERVKQQLCSWYDLFKTIQKKEAEISTVSATIAQMPQLLLRNE